MTEITLDVLAEQEPRLLDEVSRMRDDMRVMSAIVMRLDGTVQGLVREIRAGHARFDRLDQRVRKLEGTP